MRCLGSSAFGWHPFFVPSFLRNCSEDPVPFLPRIHGVADHGALFFAPEKFREGLAVSWQGGNQLIRYQGIWAYPPGRPCQQVHMPDPWLHLPWNQISMLYRHPRPSGTFPSMEPPQWRLSCRRRVALRPEPFGLHGRILSKSNRSLIFDHDALDSSLPIAQEFSSSSCMGVCLAPAILLVLRCR
jgi:hypothetical protein